MIGARTIYLVAESGIPAKTASSWTCEDFRRKRCALGCWKCEGLPPRSGHPSVPSQGSSFNQSYNNAEMAGHYWGYRPSLSTPLERSQLSACENTYHQCVFQCIPDWNFDYCTCSCRYSERLCYRSCGARCGSFEYCPIRGWPRSIFCTPGQLTNAESAKAQQRRPCSYSTWGSVEGRIRDELPIARFVDVTADDAVVSGGPEDPDVGEGGWRVRGCRARRRRCRGHTSRRTQSRAPRIR